MLGWSAVIADIPWWTKLWFKGVDIGAGVAITVISAAVIGLTATILWKWKIRRDLELEEKKIRLHIQINEEIRKEADESTERKRRLIAVQEIRQLADRLRLDVQTDLASVYRDAETMISLFPDLPEGLDSATTEFRSWWRDASVPFHRGLTLNDKALVFGLLRRLTRIEEQLSAIPDPDIEERG
jgi:hypothetical protein